MANFQSCFRTTFIEFYQSLDGAPSRRGKQFESFVKWFFKTDPEWSTQVDQVWLWDEYPERWGIDCGIDLVFRHKNGETWAVQAKCYSSDHVITKQDVDKFLSESNRKGIDKRLLIATTDRIGKNAIQVCDAQEKTVVRFLLSDFERAEIEYQYYEDLPRIRRKEPPKPRPHQLAAVSDVIKSFQNADRGQLIMACGTRQDLYYALDKRSVSIEKDAGPCAVIKFTVADSQGMDLCSQSTVCRTLCVFGRNGCKA